jgi:hypothetical protein
MAYKETFWMACDSTEQMRAEYGPFHTRAEAEQEARKLGFGFLLRYEHIIGDNEDIQEVRCIFVELPLGPVPVPARMIRKLHTRCATCGEAAGRPKFGLTSTSLSTRGIGYGFSSKPGRTG